MKRQRQGTLSFTGASKSTLQIVIPRADQRRGPDVIDLAGESDDEVQPVAAGHQLASASAVPSALARMMADPVRATRYERFWLGQSVTGPKVTWKWYWVVSRKSSVEDPSPPAWEQRVTVQYAGRPCTILLASGVSSVTPDPVIKTGFTPSLLKSALQKSIRRGHSERACTAALTLWRLSPVDLVRRLIIIAIEDVCAHPVSPVLAWLALAIPKGFGPSPAHLLLVLSLVRELCACPWRDEIDDPHDNATDTSTYDFACSSAAKALAALQQQKHEPRLRDSDCSSKRACVDAPGVSCSSVPSVCTTFQQNHVGGPDPKEPSTLPLTLERLDALTSPGASCFVRSILVRAAYGGMAHDVAMLKRSAAIWMARLGDASGLQWMIATSQLFGCAASESALVTSGEIDTWCSYVPTFSSADLARTGAAHSLRAVITAVDDGCSDLSESVLRGGGAVVDEWLARLSCIQDVRRLSREALLDVLQRQVWRFRSGLNARCHEHVSWACALCEVLARRSRLAVCPRPGASFVQKMAVSSSAACSQGGVGIAPSRSDVMAASGSWAELDPIYNQLAAASVSASFKQRNIDIPSGPPAACPPSTGTRVIGADGVALTNSGTICACMCTSSRPSATCTCDSVFASADACGRAGTCSTLSSGPGSAASRLAASGLPRGEPEFKAHWPWHDISNNDREEIEAFACIAPALEAWSLAHVGRR